MDSFRKLDSILKRQSTASPGDNASNTLQRYAEAIALTENVVAVLSDLRSGKSRIFSGAFGSLLGIEHYSEENSIWEKEILALIPSADRDEKYLAELRFYNFLRHVPRGRRTHYFLATKLHFTDSRHMVREVLHRMYYIHDQCNDAVSHALCLYGPLVFDFPGRSVAVNSVTGKLHPLSSDTDAGILTPREKQVLGLIATGRSSREISEALSISPHTVSRHRQEILAKLQVRNSVEACRVANALGILE
ncbi:LuxR C-terminal-related transcriptional regulator [uncultured Muribaculum sp.]|uniref:response regulator transcription factor n=1 Tax=uncultured Muribaculum sp. TaxID=1918613 RepID=UPI0025FD9A40|nr:LuxR C-terminal-related transcriptional regulator [uncultured Muribaculum sp.]